MRAQLLLPTLAFIALSSVPFAQQSHHWSHYLSGGIKRNLFYKGQEHIAALNPTARYDINNIRPDVRNTTSFATAFKSYKKLGKRFTFSNTIGLDMQQLSIESGLRSMFSNGTITSYSSSSYNKLSPRVKLDVGIDYTVLQKEKSQLSIGTSVGQMLRLTEAGYSYSFAEANVTLHKKQCNFFFSGSFSPYNVNLPGSEYYFGNINADAIAASIDYRIVDLTAGIAVRIK